jgi:predicted nuclease of predicted toxin-antitoxin system
MTFLIDNALSPEFADLLRRAGHNAIHDPRDVGLQRASDEAILARAAEDDAVIISADTDFGTLLATRAVAKPSVVLFRGEGSGTPNALARAVCDDAVALGLPAARPKTRHRPERPGCSVS